MKRITLIFILAFVTLAIQAQQELSFSQEEFETAPTINFATGLEFNDGGYTDRGLKIQTRSVLPEQASLKEFAPTPRNQGNYGTCVAWSTAYAARTILEAANNKWTDKKTIDDNAFSPYFVYELAKKPNDKRCQMGTDIESALDQLKIVGGAKISQFNYECPDGITQEAKSQAANFKIVDYAKIFNLGATVEAKIEAVKRSISEGKPAIIGMNCPKSFESAKLYWMRLPSDDPQQVYYRHAMCVVGYDDNKFCGAFEIINSWGTEWGNGGYMWIRYKDFGEFTRYGYEIINMTGKSANSEFDLSGEIEFELKTGGNMLAETKGNVLTMKDAYNSGTQFKLTVANNEAAFVYIIGSDLTNDPGVIFPDNPNISPALYKNTKITIPKRGWAAMNDVVGTDYFCMLYSTKPLDINTIKNQMKTAKGTFETKVKTALSTEIVDFRNVEFDTSQGRVNFKAKTGGKNVVAVIFEIKHI